MGETQPLLQHQRHAEQNHEEAIGAISHQYDADVDFDPAGDADNPQEWTDGYKALITGLLSAMAFTVTLTCVSVIPIAQTIVRDLSHDHDPTKSSGVLLVTIWELGEAVGPLLIAPLSEVLGRAPVYHACNTAFFLTVVLSALTTSPAVFILLRMLTGSFVASNVLNPAIVGDIYPHDKRGTAMSAIWIAPLVGGAFGPAIAGVVSQTLGWRTMIWGCAAVAACCNLGFLLCFRETYKVPILRRRAARLRRESVETAHEVKARQADEYRALGQSILRPATVMARSAVLAGMSLFVSVCFSQFYVLSVTFPPILEDRYRYTPAQAGSALIAFSAGSLLAVFLCNTLLDRTYIYLRTRNGTPGRPEYRLPLTILGGVLMPIPVAVFGWLTQARVPVPWLMFTSAFMAVASILVLVTISSYIVDAFGLYSASAMTGLIVSRNLMGSLLPLTADPLIERLGYGGGFTVISAFHLAVCPIPMLVMRYGHVMRRWSEFTRDS